MTTTIYAGKNGTFGGTDIVGVVLMIDPETGHPMSLGSHISSGMTWLKNDLGFWAFENGKDHHRFAEFTEAVGGPWEMVWCDDLNDKTSNPPELEEAMVLYATADHDLETDDVE